MKRLTAMLIALTLSLGICPMTVNTAVCAISDLAINNVTTRLKWNDVPEELTNLTEATEPTIYTAYEDGCTDVRFSNGYTGYGIDMCLGAACDGNSFTVGDTAVAVNNTTGVDVSQKLKILLIHHLQENYSYTNLQNVIWYYTDGRYINATQKAIADTIDAYTGDPIPDEGYSITLDNGNTVTFSFLTMVAVDNDESDFFACKLTIDVPVVEEPPHEHSYSSSWRYDDAYHWHECSCGAKTDVAEHSGISFDDEDYSYFCDVCDGYCGPVEPHPGYIVTFYANHGTLSFSQAHVGGTDGEAYYGDTPYPNVTADEHFRFLCWDKTSGKITSDTTVTALIERVNSDISFVAKDGTLLSRQIVAYGSAATVPNAPVIEGYDFIGWTDELGNVVTDFSTITTDNVYTASYEQIMHKLSFGVTMGSLSFTELIVPWGTDLSTVIYPAVTPEIGYVFSAWDVTEGIVTSDMSINATTKAGRYSVVFKDKYGTVLSQQSVLYGFAAIPPQPPIPEKHTFIGWADENGVIATDLSHIYKDTVFTATYETIQFTLHFVAVHGTISLNELKVDYGTDLSKITYPTVTPDFGYHFTGWNVTEGIVKTDLTITANLDLNRYTVAFKGVDGAEIATQTVLHGKPATAPVPPSYRGYNFVGWMTEDGDLVSDFSCITEDYEFTACYTVGDLPLDPFTFVLGAEDGTVSVDDTDGYLSFISGTMTVRDIKKLFIDADISAWETVGDDHLSDDTILSTGDSICSTTDGVKTVLTVIVNGDVNADGFIDSLDAAQILKHDAMLIELTNNNLLAADANRDQSVNSLDAAQILKYDAMIITRF